MQGLPILISLAIYTKIFFDEVKRSICLICCHRMENNTEKQVTIPCGCHFCSETHLEYFFREKKLLLKIKNIKNLCVIALISTVLKICMI